MGVTTVVDDQGFVEIPVDRAGTVSGIITEPNTRNAAVHSLGWVYPVRPGDVILAELRGDFAGVPAKLCWGCDALTVELPEWV